MIRFGCIERPIARFFYRYGLTVTRQPLPFLVIPVLIALTASTGFLRLAPLSDAIYLFTPTDAPSKLERQVIHDNWPLHDNNYAPGRAVTQSREAQVSVVARGGDEANILESAFAQAVYRLDMYIQKRIRVRYNNRTYTYEDLCLHWLDTGCPGNKHVHQLSDLYNHGVNLTYPTVRFGTKSGYIAGAMGGVRLWHGKNDTDVVASAKAWLLLYHLKFYPNNVSYISGLWERALKRHLDAYPPDPFIQITYFHSQTLADELKRNADSLMPRFVFSFVVLVLFSSFCSLCAVDSAFVIDWCVSKPGICVLGVLNAGMGIATAIGGLVLAGVPYTDIISVMPFLVVAVGTDNMFLMVAALRRTDRRWAPERRMAESLSDAAVSILITALTDAFSFGVGTITTIPAVQLFCIYTACALVCTFIYQLSFFCALLSLACRWEARGGHCIWPAITIPEAEMGKTTSSVKRWLLVGSRPHRDSGHRDNIKNSSAARFFKEWYAPLLMQPYMKALAIFWYVIYVGIACYGCSKLREGLEPVNLLVDDSYAIPHYRVLEKYFWGVGAPLQIVVNNPPDLRDPEERLRMKSMAHAFANTAHSMGDDSLQHWMFELERYYREQLDMKLVDSAFYSMTQHFMFARKSEVWTQDVRWAKREDGSATISAFRFLIGLRKISSTTEQQSATDVMREVAARYPSYNVTSFMPLWLFTDQYALVVPNTVQDVVVAVICMLAIAFLLIPQPCCAVWVAYTIGSIDLGVLGFMTLWGVNLDAISMITIIMSVGFSVDYSAHITYGYVVSKATDPKVRVQESLGDLGWPVLQGATSTILAVSSLSDVPAYMIVTFFKTVFLAISIGLVHGLVFLPLMLSVFVRGCCVAEQDRSEPHGHQDDEIVHAYGATGSRCHPAEAPISPTVLADALALGDIPPAKPAPHFAQNPPSNAVLTSQPSTASSTLSSKRGKSSQPRRPLPDLP